MPDDMASSLVREIASHKAAIRHHRSALRQAKENLVRLQRDGAESDNKITKGGGTHPWPETSSHSQH